MLKRGKHHTRRTRQRGQGDSGGFIMGGVPSTLWAPALAVVAWCLCLCLPTELYPHTGQIPWWKTTCFSSNKDQRLTPMEFVIHYWVLRTMGSPGAESDLGTKPARYSFTKRQGESKEHQKRGNSGTQTSKGGTAQTWGEGGRWELWPSPGDVVPTPRPLRHASRGLGYLQQEDAEPMGSFNMAAWIRHTQWQHQLDFQCGWGQFHMAPPTWRATGE